VEHLDEENSDHLPLLLKTRLEKQDGRRKTYHKCFKIMWTNDERCEGVIQNAWDGLTADEVVDNCLAKLDRCITKLQKWNVEELGHVYAEISKVHQ